MQKSGVFLTVVGGIVALGIILSFYGSQIITEGFVQYTDKISTGGSIQVEAILDPDVSETGVYVVQIMNFKENSISANLYDPFDSILDSSIIHKESFEKKFDVSSSGEYRLVVENSGSDTEVIIALGHLPDTNKLVIGYTGFYILIVGLIGIIVVGFIAVRNKRKGIN